MRTTRREFLSAGAGAAAGAGLSLPARSRIPAEARAGGQARNLIFMVADGMSTGTLTLGDMLCHALHGRPSAWVDLWSRPGVRRATASTCAADSLVTDSAAAASAWGIGERINNQVVNITPDGREPEPLWVRARKAGRATGLVTTTRVTHATPAGFVANIPHRDLEDGIAEQILGRGIDVVLGGGAKHFPPDLLTAHPDLTIVRSRAELLALHARAPADGRLLGLFAAGHMPHELDRAPDEPTLAELAASALGILSRAAGGFAVMIEGGRIDHSAHDNDAGAMLFNQLAFDEAIAVAAAFARGRDDTLLVITTDHGTANPGLTFYGRKGIRAFERCQRIRHSFEWIQARLSAEASADARDRQLRAIVEEATSIALADDEAATLARSMAGQVVDPFLAASAALPVLGSLLSNHLGIAFASPEHTADMVEVTALGPGTESLAPMIHATQLHTLAAGALGLAAPP